MKLPRLSCLLRFLPLAAIITSNAPAQTANPPQYYFSTFAGTSSAGSADGTGSAARFNAPTGCAIDQTGNIFIADQNKTIRKVSPQGVVTTLAGKPGFVGSTDGTGSAARFSSPAGIAVDAAGNLFVADTNNHTIRKISPNGVVTTVAGNAGLTGSTDGNGSTARFNQPIGVAVDATGNLFVTDQGNYAVRKITSAGVVSTVTGTSQSLHYAMDGSIETAQFGLLTGITVAPNGNLYVADGSQIRKITPGADVTTLGVFSYFTSTGTYLAEPWGLTIDALGNLYATDSRYGGIQKFSAGGGTTLIAAPSTRPAGQMVFTPDGSPHGIALDAAGNLAVVETFDNTLYKISPTGAVTLFAGLPRSESTGSTDATGTSARFSGPDGMAISPNGDLYIADSNNHTIRKITPAGVVTTFAGLAGTSGYVDGTLAAARFFLPSGLAIDTSGNLFVADTGNFVIRKISPAGVVTTVAGQAGQVGGVNGPASQAQFSYPEGVAVDPLGNIYVAEYGDLRLINTSGQVSFLANTLGPINAQAGVATDRTGALYWSLPDLMVINQVATPTTTSLAAATPISTASLGFRAKNIFIDPLGQIFIASDGYIATSQVAKVGTDGSVQLLGGKVQITGNTDGLGSDTLFNGTAGITVDPTGAIYLCCRGDNTIRKGVLAGPPVIATQPLSQTVVPGGSVQLSVTTTAVPEPTYQWYYNGSAFSGATTNTLSFTNARSTDAGDYTVVVTNALGSVTSNKATLTVSAASTPTPTPTPSTGSNGGGGSIEMWFALALLALGATRIHSSTRAGSQK